MYRVYQDFDNPDLDIAVLVLGTCQFYKMTESPPKLLLTLKVIKSDRKNNHLSTSTKVGSHL